MRVSVVITVKNEERTVKFLLDSLLAQTKSPNEILIVDGGSIDKTILIIEQYSRTYKNIRVIKSPGSIAHGRNIGIKNAKYDIIAQTDAGCIAEKNWLKRITKPFEKREVQMVAGFYEMVGESYFQKALAPFLGVTPQNFDSRFFLPSARSVAFRKSVWKAVGGYSEKLTLAGEDTLFNHEVLKKGIPIHRVKTAKVYWQLPNNLWIVFKKFFYYAVGDSQSGIWWDWTKKLSTHNIKIAFIYTRYLLGIVLLIFSAVNPFFFYFLIVGFIFYIFWVLWKMREIQSLAIRLWTPIIQVLSDIAVMAGFAWGIIKA